MMGWFEEALLSVDKALEIQPIGPEGLACRAVILYRLGRREQSLAMLERLLELDPDDDLACGNRAVALSSLGRHEEALLSFDRSLKLASVDFNFHICSNRAVVLAMLGRWDEGVSALDETLHQFAEEGGIDARDEVARAWRDVWQELGRASPELEIPLRLLDAAVRYREKPDVRVLLGLPIEERELLKPLLGLRETSEEKTIGDTPR